MTVWGPSLEEDFPEVTFPARGLVLDKENRVMDENGRFSKVTDGQVSLAIIRGFFKALESHIVNDVVVVGAGPSGLVCARDLARQGFKTLLVERNNYLGGGFWIGGFLMNKLTVRSPGHKELEKLGVRLTETTPGLYLADAPEACSKLIASTCDAGVQILNMTSVEDVVLRGGRVAGTVINWTPVQALPRQITCVDPISVEAKVVVDATGHDASVCKRLAQRGLLEIVGMGAMDADSSEDAIVEGTGEVFSGLIACGMSVSTVRGVPRMGPTFGGMLVSGQRAAQIAAGMLVGALDEPQTVETVVN